LELPQFAANSGRKLFDLADTNIADVIYREVMEVNPGIEELQIGFENGVVNISGKARDQVAFERVILMVGNLLGVGRVDTDRLVVSDVGAPAEFYEVLPGDTLRVIASKFLGSGDRHVEIFEANFGVLKTPESLFAGQKIRIPVNSN